MATPNLHMTFAGICSHFLNQTDLPSPHRVVLPRLGDFRFGVFHAAWLPGSPLISYFLQPHFATLRIDHADGTKELAEVEGFVAAGIIYAPAKIKIGNADPSDKHATGAWFANDRYSLQSYHPNYEYSGDVVGGGRARCVLDFTTGTFYQPAPTARDKGAVSINADFVTYGAPRLEFTPPDDGDGSNAVPLQLLDGDTLLVSNLEFDAAEIDDDTRFDYIQHYITGRNGIPFTIEQPPPGMPLHDAASLRATKEDMVKGLEKLAKHLQGSPAETLRAAPQPEDPPPIIGPTRHQILKIDPANLNPSCSDSHYP